MSKVKNLSVVIPVYNSEGSLSTLVEELATTLPRCTDTFEVILVNDGSRDKSWEKIRALLAEYPWLRAFNLMRNYGQHNALLAGIRAARYEVTVTLDDDLQNPPAEITKLLEKLNEGFDVVYGYPEKQQHGFLRDLASELTKFALRHAMGAETARHVSTYRAFRTVLRDAFCEYKSSFISIDVLLTWGTTRFVAIPVRHDPRSIGQSNYDFQKLVTHGLNMITGFSTIPLQFASMVGFGFTLFGGLILMYVIGRYFITGVVVPGFAFLASIIAIFSGAQLFAIGIFGEYLARMHFRMMEKPSYRIREEVSHTPNQKGLAA